MSIELQKEFVGIWPLPVAHTPINDDCETAVEDIRVDGDIERTTNRIHIKARCEDCKDEASFIYENQGKNRWVMVDE